MTSVDVLYLAWNRLAFTRTSFGLLALNTDWEKVDRLVVYDDGSEDGTAEWLERAGREVGVPAFEFRQVSFQSPAATMNDYLSTSRADVFAKIDNDIALPPCWLERMLGVMDGDPRLQLLGMEAGRTGPYVDPPVDYTCELASHIGGVGLMRARAFHTRAAIMARGRYGFTEWQHRHVPRRGWITPDLPVVQLDLIPEEPWRTLAAKYVANGWSREWPTYDPAHPEWWQWIPKPSRAMVAA